MTSKQITKFGLVFGLAVCTGTAAIAGCTSEKPQENYISCLCGDPSPTQPFYVTPSSNDPKAACQECGSNCIPADQRNSLK